MIHLMSKIDNTTEVDLFHIVSGRIKSECKEKKPVESPSINSQLGRNS